MAEANEKSWLTPNNLLLLKKEIQDLYKGDSRPWVIGFSGGKDSTTVLQLVWHSISELPTEQRKKSIYVISSDTLVETPVIVNHIDTSLAKINSAAQKKKLPFQAHKVSPELTNTFWVNLIGRGYPAPSKGFRWCTDRMKIQPANKFIMDKVAEHGEVIVVLGSRRQESSTRAQVMSLHKVKDSPLSRHSTLPNAFCYTPIENFSTGDVWNYLLQVPSPWNSNNHDLITLYKNAQAGECPLVVDKTTPSCGNSRFGCWVCTVVTQDHSMESLIDNGEEWMLPLLEFRNWLADTQVVEDKSKYRNLKGRNGKFRPTRTGDKIAYGPYSFQENKSKAFNGKVRQEILKRLLVIQKQIDESSPEDEKNVLISREELKEIRRIWLTEEQDWDDSVSSIFREVFGFSIDFDQDDLAAFNSEDKELLNKTSKEHDLPPGLLAKLIEAERQFHGLTKRSQTYARFEQIFKEEWKSEEDALMEFENNVAKKTNP